MQPCDMHNTSVIHSLDRSLLGIEIILAKCIAHNINYSIFGYVQDVAHGAVKD